MAKINPEERKPLPPYIPFKTLTGFIQKLKDTTVPLRVDSSLMRSYSGSVARQLVAAMKWLGLIDDNGYTKDALTKLVGTYGTDGWGDELGQVIAGTYGEVIGDLDLDKATSAMLAEKFRGVGAEGQVLQKCVTFYLAAMRNAGWAISPHLVERAPRQRGDKRRHARRPDDAGEDGDPRTDNVPTAGMVRFSLPIPNKAAATIILPGDLTADDWEMASHMVSAYISRREKK
jgi:hypothetical protein